MRTPASSVWVVWQIFHTINEISWTVSETYQESTLGEFLTKKMMNTLLISGSIHSTRDSIFLYTFIHVFYTKKNIYIYTIYKYDEWLHISSSSVVVANQFQKTVSLIHPLGISMFITFPERILIAPRCGVQPQAWISIEWPCLVKKDLTEIVVYSWWFQPIWNILVNLDHLPG